MASISEIKIPVKMTAALTLNELQELASRTLPGVGVNHFFNFPCGGLPQGYRDIDLIHAAFGLAGEVGELIDPIKKSMFYGKPLDVENLREEAGDLLWYIAGPLCRALGCTLEDLAQENVAKLRKRYPDRYTDAAAIVRADKRPASPNATRAVGSEPTRPGYRWKNMPDEERAEILSKYRHLTVEDGFFFDEDEGHCWQAIEALWVPDSVG